MSFYIKKRWNKETLGFLLLKMEGIMIKANTLFGLALDAKHS